MLWLPAAAFSALGLLIGSLAGLTVSPVVVTLIAALFTFVGGSAAAFFGKLDVIQLRLASIGVLSLSVFMLLGLVGGIFVKANRLLTLDPAERAAGRQEIQKEPFLRSQLASTHDDLQASVKADQISLENACRVLAEAAKRQDR